MHPLEMKLVNKWSELFSTLKEKQQDTDQKKKDNKPSKAKNLLLLMTDDKPGIKLSLKEQNKRQIAKELDDKRKKEEEAAAKKKKREEKQSLLRKEKALKDAEE